MSTKIDLCGENGLINQINSAQRQINEVITQGKNAIGAINGAIQRVKTVSNALKNDPETVLRTIQEDVLQVISEESLRNPAGALAKLLEIKAAYESAGPAVERIIQNVEQFIKDPLNTPLDVCNDIPNLKRLGDAVIEVVQPAKVPAPDASPAEIREEVAKEIEEVLTVEASVSEEDLQTQREQTVPTSPRYPTPDVGNDRVLAGRTPPGRTFTPRPGDAHAAAIYHTQRPVESVNPTDGTRTQPRAAAPAPAPAPRPQPSLPNPFPGGKQYTAADFAPSKYATNIARQINTMDPSLRGLFAAGIQDYLKNNFKDGRDCNVTEGYRSPERSAQLAASGIRAAPAGRSWHNYGAAADLAIYVNGKWDQGTRGDSEYTGRARQSMQKFGLINDLRGDSGHFYVAALGAGVPRQLREGQTTLAALARSKGVNTA